MAMKPTLTHERALRAITVFEQATARQLPVTREAFAEAAFAAAGVFAGSDACVLVQRNRDMPNIPTILQNGEHPVLTAAQQDAWKQAECDTSPKFVKNNDGTIVDKYWQSWISIPVCVKKEPSFHVIFARKGDKFQKDEIEATERFTDFLTQALQKVRHQNRRIRTITDDERHRLLLHTQNTTVRTVEGFDNLALETDYSARTGSDIAGVQKGIDQSLCIYTADLTAGDAERQTGIIYIDTWFAILSQTSLDAKGMLAKLNADMVRRRNECYAAVSLIKYSPKDRKAEIAGCGNAGILVFSHDTMDVREITFGPAAGIKSDIKIEATVISVKPGDIVCAFTDGISGMRKRNGDLFGAAEIGETIRKNYYLSAHELCIRVLESAKDKEQKNVNADDRTVQILKIQ